jgi:hypothetical protein
LRIARRVGSASAAKVAVSSSIAGHLIQLPG